MKLGIIIYSLEPEIVWNAFRLGVFSLKAGDQVSVFLLGKGVECENIQDEKFDVKSQMQTFVETGGEILACGTCLKIRQMSGSKTCPVSSMKDLYEIIKQSDKVLTF
jgi:uncharacterized protein involved in oxidation of intracellular sulfur